MVFKPHFLRISYLDPLGTVPTLGTSGRKVHKQDLLGAIWSTRINFRKINFGKDSCVVKIPTALACIM